MNKYIWYWSLIPSTEAPLTQIGYEYPKWREQRETWNHALSPFSLFPSLLLYFLPRRVRAVVYVCVCVERETEGEREREWQRWRGRERACVIARRAHVEVRVRGESGSGNWVFSYDRAAKMFQLFCELWVINSVSVKPFCLRLDSLSKAQITEMSIYLCHVLLSASVPATGKCRLCRASRAVQVNWGWDGCCAE